MVPKIWSLPVAVRIRIPMQRISLAVRKTRARPKTASSKSVVLPLKCKLLLGFFHYDNGLGPRPVEKSDTRCCFTVGIHGRSAKVHLRMSSHGRTIWGRHVCGCLLVVVGLNVWWRNCKPMVVVSFGDIVIFAKPCLSFNSFGVYMWKLGLQYIMCCKNCACNLPSVKWISRIDVQTIKIDSSSI